MDENFRKHYYKRNINQRQTHTRVATPRAGRLPNRRPHIIAPRGVFRQYVPMELPRQPSRGAAAECVSRERTSLTAARAEIRFDFQLLSEHDIRLLRSAMRA